MKGSSRNPAELTRLVARIRALRARRSSAPDDRRLSEAYRDYLRAFRLSARTGAKLGSTLRQAARDGLSYLGGQADRHAASLADYDHRRYGPFLGVSDEGSSAPNVHRAARAAPKAVALGSDAEPLTVGVALDAERLGGVGEVPVGLDEFADLWSACAGRTLMTTNVGSRANLRFYRRSPVVTIAAGAAALASAKLALAEAYKPFLEAVGGPRPLDVFVQFARGSNRSPKTQVKLLRALRRYVESGHITAPKIHRLGLAVAIGWGLKGRDAAVRAIDVCYSAGIDRVAIDGVVRKEADQMISLAGLLNYLPPDLAGEVLVHGKATGIRVRPINHVDPDTVAREIWSSLNTARAMGFDLGKYGLVPLTLEESDAVVERVQRWFPDWCAAPVFYVDQGIVTRNRVYVGADTARGVKAWLDVMAGHAVKVVLIDTVDKALGWRILKTGGDPKGILEPDQIASLNEYGRKLGIRMLWAGGITPEHAFEFGRLGVFGIYVTTAASEAAPAGASYADDPAVASVKEPTYEGVLRVKTLIEGGFLVGRVPAALRGPIERAGLDAKRLAKALPAAWRAWWRLSRGGIP